MIKTSVLEGIFGQIRIRFHVFAALRALSFLLFIVFCACVGDPMSNELSADIRITDTRQSEYSQAQAQNLGLFTDSDSDGYTTKYSAVTVNYRVKNTGGADIQAYTLYFRATCADGSTFYSQAAGTAPLKSGKTVDAVFSIDTAAKPLDGVLIDDYELSQK